MPIGCSRILGIISIPFTIFPFHSRPPPLQTLTDMAGVSEEKGGFKFPLSSKDRQLIFTSWDSIADKKEFGQNMLIQIFMYRPPLKRLFHVMEVPVGELGNNEHFCKPAAIFVSFISTVITSMKHGTEPEALKTIRDRGADHYRYAFAGVCVYSRSCEIQKALADSRMEKSWQASHNFGVAVLPSPTVFHFVHTYFTRSYFVTVCVDLSFFPLLLHITSPRCRLPDRHGEWLQRNVQQSVLLFMEL